MVEHLWPPPAHRAQDVRVLGVVKYGRAIVQQIIAAEPAAMAVTMAT